MEAGSGVYLCNIKVDYTATGNTFDWIVGVVSTEDLASETQLTVSGSTRNGGTFARAADDSVVMISGVVKSGVVLQQSTVDAASWRENVPDAKSVEPEYAVSPTGLRHEVSVVSGSTVSLRLDTDTRELHVGIVTTGADVEYVLAQQEMAGSAWHFAVSSICDSSFTHVAV